MREANHHPNDQQNKRRGTVAAWTAVSLVMMLSFCALAIDSGHLYTVRAELQNAADAAALAAASELGGAVDFYESAALSAAQLYAYKNKVMNGGVDLENADVEYGRAQLVNDKWVFVPGGGVPDAVRVTVRRTDGSTNGPVPLFFAPIMGKHSSDVAASATAMLIPRDIALVADLSASHTDDSELGHYDMTEINLWEVWDALPGGLEPGDVGYTDQQAGPNWGYFGEMGWGTMDIDSGYSPSSDSGLAYLPKNQNWSNAQLSSWLSAQNYSSSEVSAIMAKSSSSDSYWDNRVAVALGLAVWRSGKSGGKWQVDGLSPGNGNSTIGSSELTWVVDYPYPGGSWSEYFDHVKSTSTAMENANSQFRYRFGPKTFVNYLLEDRERAQDTPALANAPVQPMQAVKDAVSLLSGVIDELDGDDRLSLEAYDTWGHHEVDLTDQYHLVSNRLNEMQAGHYGPNTNMGAGIEQAIAELTGPRARDNAVKVMFLLTDGYANVNSSGNAGDYSEGEAYAWAAAQEAAAAGIRIYCVTVGANTNRAFMQQIAEMGGGEEFHAEGSIDEYTAELQEIFARLGGARPVVLIE